MTKMVWCLGIGSEFFRPALAVITVNTPSELLEIVAAEPDASFVVV